MVYSSCDGWVTLQGSKCKCNCFATFSLRSKSSTLVCIFGDCNMRLLFTSRKKTTSVRMLLKLGTGNGERESGNECTAVTRLRIQNGGGNNVYKHWFYR